MNRMFLILLLATSSNVFARPNSNTNSNSHANASKTALLLIDMQYGFYERGKTTGTEGLETLVQNQIALLREAVEAKIPVAILQYNGFKETDSRLLEVLEKYGNVAKIQKSSDSGFTSPELNVQLQKWQAKTLIVAGVNGCCCVYSTVADGLRMGYKVVTSPEIVGNINSNPPKFPNNSWYPPNSNKTKFVVYPTLNELLNYIAEQPFVYNI